MVHDIGRYPAPLNKWLEEVVRLLSGITADAGPLHLHPYQRAMADAMADPSIERVSVMKSARIDFTTLLVGAIAHFVVRDPSPVLVLMRPRATRAG